MYAPRGCPTTPPPSSPTPIPTPAVLEAVPAAAGRAVRPAGGGAARQLRAQGPAGGRVTGTMSVAARGGSTEVPAYRLCGRCLRCHCRGWCFLGQPTTHTSLRAPCTDTTCILRHHSVICAHMACAPTGMHVSCPYPQSCRRDLTSCVSRLEAAAGAHAELALLAALPEVGVCALCAGDHAG